MTRRQAITEAIDWCIENGFMQDYLLQKKDEVFGMLDWQWNIDEAQLAWEHKAQEAREEGKIYQAEKIAKNLLQMGNTFDMVQKATGLPLERVIQLANFNVDGTNK